MSIEVENSFCHNNSNFLIEQFLQELKVSQNIQKFDKYFLPNETFLDKKNIKNSNSLNTSTEVKWFFIFKRFFNLLIKFLLSP